MSKLIHHRESGVREQVKSFMSAIWINPTGGGENDKLKIISSIRELRTHAW